MKAQRFRHSLLIYGGAEFGLKLLSFLALPVLAHTLTVAAFGQINVLLTALGLLVLLGGLGINHGMLRDVGENGLSAPPSTMLSVALTAMAIWSAVLFSGILLITFLAADWIVETSGLLIWPLRVVVVLAAPMLVIQTVQDYLRARFSPLKAVLVSSLRTVPGLGLAVVAVAGFQLGVGGYVGSLLVGAVPALIVGLVLVRHELRFRLDRKHLSSFLSFGFPVALAGGSYWLLSSVDRWMLLVLADPVEVGLYGIAFQLGGVITLLTASFGQAWQPHALRLYGSDQYYGPVIGRVGAQWLYGLALVAAAATLFAHEGLLILTPQEYWQAADLMGPVVAALVASGSTQFTALGMSFARRTHLVAVATTAAAALNAFLNLVLIPWMGAFGAALASTVSFIFLSGICAFFSQRSRPLPLRWNWLIASMAVMAGSIGLALAMNGREWEWWMVLAKLAYIAMVASAAFLFGLFSLRSLRGLMNNPLNAIGVRE